MDLTNASTWEKSLMEEQPWRRYSRGVSKVIGSLKLYILARVNFFLLVVGPLQFRCIYFTFKSA